MFVSLNFYGHVLHYRAIDRLLFWEPMPDAFVPLTAQTQLAQLAARTPYPMAPVRLTQGVENNVPVFLAAPTLTDYPDTDDDALVSKFRTVG